MAEHALKSISATAERDEAPPVRERPVAPAARPSDHGEFPGKDKRTDRRRIIRYALFALLPIAFVLGGHTYVSGGKIMSTDDAYVNAEKVPISTDVAGLVQEVDVADNQYVTAGQILYRLDPRQFQIALDNAKANLAQSALAVDAMKQDYKHMISDVAAEQAQVDLDQTTYNRESALVRSGTVSQAVFDQAQYTLLNDKSKLESLRLQAQAQVQEAQRQLDHTVVRAPFSGTVTDVPSIAPGKYLAASTTAFYLVDTDHVWIDANPKETELTYVRPGQSVTVTVDTYPNAVWHGTVQSISPAAAQEFSLLPAQNSSGNWVKVVQRVPMRIRVDTSDRTLPPLRAGMSVEVNVDTGHARGLPHLW